jgi:hypothetical protein
VKKVLIELTAEEAAKSLSAGFRRSKLFKREGAEEEKREFHE